MLHSETIKQSASRLRNLYGHIYNLDSCSSSDSDNSEYYRRLDNIMIIMREVCETLDVVADRIE